MSLTTVGAPHGVSMQATVQARHLCPFVKEIDDGTVTVHWITQGRTFELHSLRRHLDNLVLEYEFVEISHEEFIAKVRESLSMNGHLHGVQVTTVSSDWNTAGMPVTCSI